MQFCPHLLFRTSYSPLNPEKKLIKQSISNLLSICLSQVSQDARLDLPQIAVVGSQSSGKSSVLEALVGRDFLPRGPNIVTRRPLILQLVRKSSSHAQQMEWGEFLHCPGKRFFDFERIKDEIMSETDRLLGSNKAISDEPIRLKIFSPSVLTMTLVDLPGIARVPMGDQPPDIERQLRSLILKYISSPSCIILAVSPANQDLASSDALDVARDADPEGSRTIGVLTKLDIMDRGTDALTVLRNEVIPLRLGYVGVVLRSQEDIVQGQSMAAAREAEAGFFKSRSEYATVAERCGVSMLAQTLNQILVEAIMEALPALRARVQHNIDIRRRELRFLGDSPPAQTDAARGALLLSILDSYSERFSAMLDGYGEHVPISELAGGARIRHIFQEIFNGGLNALDPTSELTDEDVRTAIKNSGGIKGSLLIPEAPFELLVHRAIERLLPPALQCKEFVYAELLRIAAHSVPPEVARFPHLKALLKEAIGELVARGAGPAEQMIRNLVACELSFINTSHPDFIGGNKAIAMVLERKTESGVRPESGSHRNILGAIHGRKGTGGGGGAEEEVKSRLVADRADGLNLDAGRQAPMTKFEPELFMPEELLSGRQSLGEGFAKRSLFQGNGDGQKSLSQAAGGGWLSSWFSKPESGLRDGSLDSSIKIESLERPPLTLKVPKTITDQEEVQVEVTRLLVESYFDIVRRNLQDAVPKALMHFLINATRKGLQQHLIKVLYREELLSELMKEREDVATRRQLCHEALLALQSALHVLESTPAELASHSRTISHHNWESVESAAGGRAAKKKVMDQKIKAGDRSRSNSPLKSGLLVALSPKLR